MPAFDPYYKWLGISPKHQPPNHYRLLAIDEFEPDPDVIAAAADRQMAYVRQCAGGEHADAAQRLLSELATARLDLLNAQKKAEYDTRLRWQFRPRENVSDSRENIIEFETLEESTIAEPPLETPRASAARARDGIERLRQSARSLVSRFRFSRRSSVLLLAGAISLVAIVLWIAAKPTLDRQSPDDAADRQLTGRPDSNSEETELASAAPLESGEKPPGAKPGESTPVDPVPADPLPSTPVPAEAKPVEAEPTMSKSAESKPAEPESDQPEPDEPKATESKPAEPEPDEPKPAEPKPTEPDSENPANAAAPPGKMRTGRTRADLNGQVAGEVWDGNGLQIKFCWCPPGAFTMGSPPGEKRRGTIENQVSVRLTDGFWLGQFEVTQSEWYQMMKTSPWKQEEVRKPAFAMKRTAGAFPATFVSWEDAMEFCNKFTARERERARLPFGWRYDLPTEAQWEYACRAGTETRFSCGEDASQLEKYAWFNETTYAAGAAYAHPVGKKKPNAWGLHDLHGNVWEWCRDSYDESLPGGSNPFVNIERRNRATRGGGWNDPAENCRSANRDFNTPRSTANNLGFRVAIVRVAIVPTEE